MVTESGTKRRNGCRERKEKKGAGERRWEPRHIARGIDQSPSLLPPTLSPPSPEREMRENPYTAARVVRIARDT